MNGLWCVCIQYDTEPADLVSEFSLLCAVPFCRMFIIVICIGIACRGILFTDNIHIHFDRMQ